MMNFLQTFADDANKITINKNDLGLSGAPTSLGQPQIVSLLGTVYIAAGVVAVLVIIWGGIRYTTSNGDASATKSAKDTVLYAVIGLIVAVLAYAIVNFTLSAFKSGS